MVSEVRNEIGRFKLIRLFESLIKATESNFELSFKLVLVGFAASAGIFARFLSSNLHVEMLDLGLPF